MVQTTLKQLGKRFNSFYMVSDLNLEFMEHRAAMSAGKPVSILRSLFSSCLDCSSIFVLARHECVTQFTVFYFISRLDISERKAFLTKPTLY